MPLVRTLRRAGLVALWIALIAAGVRSFAPSAVAATPAASAPEPIAQAQPTETAPNTGGALPDLALTRRDSLSLPMTIGGPLVYDMVNVGGARSGATSLAVSWDGQPAKSFYVPPLDPGQRTGLRMVVPEGVQTVTAEVNASRSFPEARTDNNKVVETVGAGPVQRNVTSTAEPAPPPPVAPARKPRVPPRASPSPSPESASAPKPPAEKPQGTPFKLPPELFLILGAVGVLAGIVAVVIAVAHRMPGREDKPRIVALPEFHSRPVTSHAAVRTPAVTPRDPHIRPHEPPAESSGPRPTVWDVFEAGDQATVAQRELLDETAFMKALRARVGTVGDTYWDHVYKLLLETMRDAMSMPLEQMILLPAWSRWAPLQPLLADSRTRQQEDIVVPTGTSTVAATHHVHVTAQMGGALVRPGLGLVIEVASVFEACTFVIHQGRIIEVETVGPKVEGVVRCDSAPVLRRELSSFELPRIVVAEPSIEARSPDRGAPVV